MVFEYQIIKSKRRSISISIDRHGEVIVRAPKYVSDRVIEGFVREKSDWIEKRLLKRKEEDERAYDAGYLIDEDIKILYKKAKEELPPMVEEYARILNVTYGRITVRMQKSRWGSCSSKGNLNFNCLLMLAPKEVQEYVVVHELCHRREMNHSDRFWRLVETVLPDYKKRRKWLKDNGGVLLKMAEYEE